MKDQEKMSEPFRLPINFNLRVDKVPGPPDLLNSGSFSCSSPFSKSPKVEERVSSFPNLIRCSRFTQSGDNRGDNVVERSLGGLEWQGPVLSPSRLGDRNSCLSPGLGAYCEGVRTGGPWALPEQRLHINCLELIAGSFALKSFTRDRACVHVHLLMYNVSAVSYINKVGAPTPIYFQT